MFLTLIYEPYGTADIQLDRINCLFMWHTRYAFFLFCPQWSQAISGGFIEWIDDSFEVDLQHTSSVQRNVLGTTNGVKEWYLHMP